MKKRRRKWWRRKKGITLKMSSKKEELYNTSCEDENAELAMLAIRYKKLSFQRNQRMGIKRRSFRKDRFRNKPSRNNQITCYGCKQPKHMRSEIR